MGVHRNVSYNRFPDQGEHLGAEVHVCFNFDMRNTIPGVVVRDDLDDPFVTIIRLADGRHILAAECQYTEATS